MTSPRRSPHLTLACLALAGVSCALMQSLVVPATVAALAIPRRGRAAEQPEPALDAAAA